MKKYSKKYVNVITGVEQDFEEKTIQMLPTRQHNGRKYKFGGWVLKKDDPVKVPEAAKPREFTDKDADIVREKIKDGDRKGLTFAIIKKFAEYEGVEFDQEDGYREVMKKLRKHVEG